MSDPWNRPQHAQEWPQPQSATGGPLPRIRTGPVTLWVIGLGTLGLLAVALLESGWNGAAPRSRPSGGGAVPVPPPPTAHPAQSRPTAPLVDGIIDLRHLGSPTPPSAAPSRPEGRPTVAAVDLRSAGGGPPGPLIPPLPSLAGRITPATRIVPRNLPSTWKP